MSQEKGLKLEEMELRRGPWTLEEDSLLIHYIARHGEGRWNLLASTSGLKRTGKSCRLRWLNYLKPDVKRGNLSPEEQFLILDLHSKWGNRWSRIAQYLPGRTDNEIKNYWRTRVQKQARQLNIDANSATFRDALRCYWMPRLLEKMVSDTNNTSPPLIQSPTIIPNTTALISHPQEHSINPQPELNYFDFDPTGVNYYTEMVDQIEPCTYANTSASTSSAPMEPFVHGMNVDDYLLPYECCMDEDYRSNWVGMNEWSGIML